MSHSDTVEKSEGTLSKAQQEKLQQAKVKEELQKQLESEQKSRQLEQNWWFYSIMDLEKIEKTDSKEKKFEIVRKNIAAKKKEGKKEQKHNVEEIKFEPQYLDRLRQSEAMLEEIKTYLPAADSLVKRFQAAHKEAGELLADDPMAWKEAYAVLARINLGTAEEDAAKLWKAGEKNGREMAKKGGSSFYEDVDLMTETILALKELVTVEKYEALVVQLDVVAGSLSRTPAPSGKDVEKAAESLAALEREVNATRTAVINANERQSVLRSETRTLFTEAEKAVRPYGGFSDQDLANFMRQRQAMRTSVERRDFAGAVELLEGYALQVGAKRDEIVSRSEKAAKLLKEQGAAWKQGKKELAGLMDRADSLAGNEALPDSVRLVAREAVERLGVLAGAEPTGAGLGEALGELAEIKRELEQMKAVAEDVPEFTKVRDAVAKRVQARLTEAARAVEGLPGALERANGNEGLNTSAIVTPFDEALSELAMRWEGLVATAISVEDLGEETMVADIATLIAEVGLVATEGADDAVLDILLAPSRALYDEQAYQAEEVAASVMSINPDKGIPLMEAVEAADAVVLAATTAEEIMEQAELLKGMRKGLEGVSMGAGFGIAGFQQVLREALKEVPGLIEAFREAINLKRDTAIQQPNIALMETMQTEYETLLLLATREQKAVLDKAIDEAEALVQGIKDATVQVGKQEKKKPGFPMAKKMIAGFLKRLADADVKAYATASATELSEALTEMQKDFGKVLIPALFAELEALGKKVTKAEEYAAENKVRTGRFEELITLQKTRLGKDPFKTDSPKYAEATKKRLDQILADAKFEGGMMGAQKQFTQVLQELDTAEKSPLNFMKQHVDLADKEKGTIEAQRKAELDKSKWEGSLVVVERQLTAAKSGEVDSDEIAGLKKMFADCKKSVAKTGQYGDGKEQLKIILNRLALLEANPYGLVISARNKLPEVVGRVRGQIVRLSKALSEVTTGVEQVADTDLSPDDKKLVVAQLAALRGLFNPAVFAKSVPIVASAQTVHAKRASAREAALRDVRRMLHYVNDDYRMKTLVNTPFKPDMPSVVSGLLLGLLDLENNLLVSMAS